MKMVIDDEYKDCDFKWDVIQNMGMAMARANGYDLDKAIVRVTKGIDGRAVIKVEV